MSLPTIWTMKWQGWLENYLNRFKGVVIIQVTHDRYFLDRVTNKILELSHGKIYTYKAKYSQFLEMKAEREEMELASERKRHKYFEDGTGMGKTRLPCKNDQAESKA